MNDYRLTAQIHADALRAGMPRPVADLLAAHARAPSASATASAQRQADNLRGRLPKAALDVYHAHQAARGQRRGMPAATATAPAPRATGKRTTLADIAASIYGRRA